MEFMMAYSEQEDSEIIAAVVSGKTEAFSILLKRYQNKVLAFCVHMLRNESEAEDAAQEIFMKAFTSLTDFRCESSFSTWIYRIAFNHCCNLRRKSYRTKQESFDAMPEELREKVLRSADREIVQPSEPEISAVAMAALPATYRAVVAMRLEGENYAGIAAALGVSVNSVKAKLRRARIILRTRLRHLLPGQVSKRTERL
jgi:RNA polymerase sigma factor (sigma-70 family)